MKDEIQHFSHKHRLKLNESYKFNANCAAWILSGAFYSCNDCRYYLHKECAKLEDEIEHFLHPIHSLKLHKLEGEGAFFCSVCHKLCRGYTYYCRRCNFKIDIQCALELEIWFPIHEHNLKLQVSDTDTEPSFFCDFCQTRCYSHRGRSLHCKEDCNFKIDLDCARMLLNPVFKPILNSEFEPILNSEVEPIQHVSHEHWLIYDDSITGDTGNANCYACREQLSSSSPFYECSDCAFYLHESCGLDLIRNYRLYKHIQNHFHNHPLEIVYYGRNVPGFVCCTLCGKCCFGPTYVCFRCKFFLHDSCLELLGTNRISQNSFHKHPLIIVDNKVNDSTSYFFMNNIDFPSCSACGEPCFEKSFACLKCKFLIHELCLELPQEIQHFFHPCPLSLQQETTNFTCRACEKRRSQFAYHCNRCHFFLDVECALMFNRNFKGQNYILSYYHHHPLNLCNKESNDHEVSCDGCNQVISNEIYGCIQCDFYLHRSCAAVPHQIKHPLHPVHTLNLFFDEKLLCRVSILKSLDKMGKVKYLRHKHFSIHDDEGNEACCGVCEKHVCGPSYECIRCKFFIHQDCIEPVEEGQHPFQPHDNDSLIGVSRKTLPRKKFTCDACSCKSCFGFSYRCEECSFKLDANCASLKPPIKYEGHQHLLTFFEKVYDDPQCEVCNTCYSDVSYLRCVECDYNVHLLCVPLPVTIKHKCHIDPLYLEDYFVEDYSGEYYCDACENSRDPRECVYRCEECSNYVAQINCVIDEVLLSLRGKRGDVELRIVDRHNIDEKISKRGLTLKEIFNSSNEDEKREFEDAEAAIVDLVGEIMSKADSGNRDIILEDLVNSDETFILILKNLKYRMRVEDISSLRFLELELELAKVRKYMVSQNWSHILEPLFVKYRDFCASSTSDEFENLNHYLREKDILRMTFLELESELVKVRDSMYSQNCAHILEPLFVKYRDICAISISDEIFIPILKNINHPMREDILNMTFLELESEVVEVRDYMVSRNCAPILESLFDKYGDISASSTSNPRTKMRVLNIVGGVAQSMCNTMVKDITPYLLFNWWKNFQLAQHVGFNVQFAFDHLYRLARAQFHMSCEFEANRGLYDSQKKIEDLPTKLEVLKNKQKQLIQSIKKKSILEKESLTQVMESRFMPAGMGLL